MEEILVSLRRFEALVTNYLRRAKSDPSLRTELVIIASLTFLCLANIIIVWMASYYLNSSSSIVLRDAYANMFSNGVFVVNPDNLNTLISDELRHIRNSTLIVVGTIGIILTLIMGFLIGRIALGPTRNALAAQKQFIANLAHELRTPLSIIRANNEILAMETDKHDDGVITMSRSNVEELDRVSGIINNLLTLNTFKDKGELDFEPINVSLILHKACDKMSRLIASKDQQLIRKIGSNLYAEGNLSAIEQIAINLIKNASIYTPKGGRVAVSLNRRPADGFIEMKITDSGIGIEKSKLNKIFEPFYQIDPSRSGGDAGSSRGLGLTIVSELIKMHKGRISVSSRPEIGTTISVWLPVVDRYQIEPKRATASNEVTLDFST